MRRQVIVRASPGDVAGWGNKKKNCIPEFNNRSLLERPRKQLHSIKEF